MHSFETWRSHSVRQFVIQNPVAVGINLIFCFSCRAFSFSFSDKPGNATISPASMSVVKGDNVTLECSVNDPGSHKNYFASTEKLSSSLFARPDF